MSEEIEVAKAIENLIGSSTSPIGHHDLYIDDSDRIYISNALDGSKYKSNVGSTYYVDLLQQRIAKYCGVEHAIATSSGTAALHVALLACGIEHDDVFGGDEVLMPAMTFAGVAHAVIQAGGTPHFVDGKYGINAYKLLLYLNDETKFIRIDNYLVNKNGRNRVRAIIGTDLLGVPDDYAALQKLADQYNLILIEDAAEALGSELNGKKCGSFGKAAIFSFNTNKIVSGNGGGMLLTDDAWVAAEAYRLSTTGRIPHAWEIKHDAVGFNYRMPDLNACLILAQLQRFEEILSYKRRLKAAYMGAINAASGVYFRVSSNPMSISNEWLISIELHPSLSRIGLLQELHNRGIFAREMFTPLHKLPHLADYPKMDNLMTAEAMYENTICLPSGMGLVP